MVEIGACMSPCANEVLLVLPSLSALALPDSQCSGPALYSDVDFQARSGGNSGPHYSLLTLQPLFNLTLDH